MRKGFKRHPLSKLFGDMAEQALLELAEDVRAHGVLEPVVLHDGMVLDGWHRCQAGQICQIDIPTTVFDGEDPAAFVISKNLHRRQQPLSASQRAMIVVEANEIRGAGNPNLAGNPHKTQLGTSSRLPRSDLAKQAQTSERTITDAQKAKEAGFSDEVRNGEKSAKQAAAEARGTSKEKAPSKTEKLEAQISEYQEQIQYLTDSIDNLKDELRRYDVSSLGESDQLVELEKLQIRNRTLESQCKEYQATADDWKRRAKALERKLKRLGQ